MDVACGFDFSAKVIVYVFPREQVFQEYFRMTPKTLQASLAFSSRHPFTILVSVESLRLKQYLIQQCGEKDLCTDLDSHTTLLWLADRRSFSA